MDRYSADQFKKIYKFCIYILNVVLGLYQAYVGLKGPVAWGGACGILCNTYQASHEGGGGSMIFNLLVWFSVLYHWIRFF